MTIEGTEKGLFLQPGLSICSFEKEINRAEFRDNYLIFCWYGGHRIDHTDVYTRTEYHRLFFISSG